MSRSAAAVAPLEPPKFSGSPSSNAARGAPSDPRMRRVASGSSPSIPRTSDIRRQKPTPGALKRGVRHATVFILVLGCSCWTVWLVALSVFPNATINRVMNTASCDNGAFWLLPEPSMTMKLAAAVGFAIVLAGKNLESYKLALSQTLADISADPRRGSLMASAAKMAVDFASETSRARQFTNIGIKLGDFALQVALLVQSLENGQPLVLVYLLTAIITLNAIACVLMSCLKGFQFGIVQVLVNCLFDFLIVVAFPMTVVTYCLSTFVLNREKLAINEVVFPPGVFERFARVIADPVQLAVILGSLNSLRIQSVFSFCTRIGTNLMLCFQFRNLANCLDQPRRTHSMYPYRHPAVVLIFVLLPIATVVYVAVSVSSAQSACSVHSECAVHAHHWTRDRENEAQCPCLTLIDGDIAPKTYAVWQQPMDVTDKVAQLAAAGYLQTIQLTNRRLPALPVELRRCTGMKHIALSYTHTTSLPAWFKELTRLEFLHIEGAFDIASLDSLPEDLFDDMNSLTFLHLAVHQHLRRLPSLLGLVNLQSLTLALLLELEELPVFTSLTNLERLILPVSLELDALPDMTPLAKLQDFVFTLNNKVCCNGFLDNVCDLSKPVCTISKSWGSSPAACLPSNRTDKVASEATRQFVARFPYSVCPIVPLSATKMNEGVDEEQVAKCNGTLYRQCETSGNSTGMCYSLRMMVIACNGAAAPIEMRKRQIAEQVGDACDPEHEAWLGCRSP